MVISHPHFYTTYVEWATRFDCPVYLAVDDQQWICRVPSDEKIIKFIEGPVGATQTILPGVTAIKAGGHFPGSLVLHWNDQLFIADTIMTVPVRSTSCLLLSVTINSCPVCAFTPPTPSRSDELQLPVVYSEHDSPDSSRNYQHLAGNQAVQLPYHIWGF